MDDLTSKLVEHYKQWILGATKPRGLVLPKAAFEGHPERNYSLKGKETRHYLQWEEQDFGINLGWTDDGTDATGNKVSRWFFARNGKSEGPIQFGETIAMGYGIKPSFFKYKERTFGINLDWSESPVFEWKLLGGKAGTPVHTQEWIAIFNEKEKECFIYFDRTAGGDIGWPTSQTWSSAFVSKLKEEAKDLTKEGWEAGKKAAAQYLLSSL